MKYSSLVCTIASHTKKKVEGIRLSKFVHSSDRGEAKILFLATDDRKILGILKMVRDSAYNDKLHRERKGQEEAGKILQTFKTPRVYFDDMVDGHYVYFEEVIIGNPVGKRGAPSFIPWVYQYQEEIPRGKEIGVMKLIELLSVWNDAPPEYTKPLSHLGRLGGVVHTGRSHGDVTYMNIIQGPNAPYLIDWERYGERPVWGVDFVHFVARCAGAGSVEDFMRYLHALPLDLDESYFERAYLIDRLLDLLQKRRPDLYGSVVPKLITLCKA